METLHLTNNIQEVPLLAEWIEQLGEKWDIPMEKVFNLNLALEEAVVNVMNYAYPDQSGMPITVTAQRDDTGSITFQITDEGTPFDPTIQEDPDITLSAEERQIGGLGIFLVKELMTSVHYTRHDNKNILTLTM